MIAIKQFQDRVGEYARKAGWCDRAVPLPETIALMHSELSEALEHYRNHRKVHEIFFLNKDGEELDETVTKLVSDKPDGIPVEFADVIIRIFHWAFVNDVDMEEVLSLKQSYNEQREYRHGGKRI
jgi:hypothetical protein